MRIIFSIAALIVTTGAADLHARQTPPHCGNLAAPGTQIYDYTNSEDKKMLATVEAFHFTSDVENLRAGATGTIGADLNYTLLMFPNHHRALAAMGKLAQREKTLKPKGAQYSVECFFDRAIRFKPNDAMVRMVYATYLLQAAQPDRATEQLVLAAELQPDDPTINYNLGLLYVKKKDYEQARTHARKAYDQGFPLPGLRNQLIQAGKWED
jgi:Flp pilus assembly protein TadD